MDMKPEYNHGVHRERYHLYLSSDNVGETPLAVKAVLAKYVKKFAEYSDDIFLQLCTRPNSRVFSHIYYGQFVEAFRTILAELIEAGATPTVIDESEWCLFPRYALYQLIMDKWIHWYRMYQRDPQLHQSLLSENEVSTIQPLPLDNENIRLSRHLTAIEEYALDLWAEDNGIAEVYRAYVKRSHTPPMSDVLRIWRKYQTFEAVAKHQNSEHGSPEANETLLQLPAKDKIDSTTVSVSTEQWYAFQQFMDTEFWTAKSWYSLSNGTSIWDGYDIIIEGYRHGQYKVLYDVVGGKALAAYNLLAAITGHRTIGI